MDDRPPAGHGYIYGVADEKGYLQVDQDEKPTIKGKPPDPASIICQFCAKSWAQVPIMFAAQRPVRDPNTFASIAVSSGRLPGISRQSAAPAVIGMRGRRALRSPSATFAAPAC